MNDTMRKTWLIQRLNKPYKPIGPFTDNPFSFGGGLKNGGLSDEAMGLIREIWSFDYMGAAEFEFGAVPKALQKMAKEHKNLVASSVEIDKSTIEKHWSKKATQATGMATVFILAPKEMVPEVKSRIKEWATVRYTNTLKETTNLAEVLNPQPNSYADRLGGWLELDNGFMFFTDEEMFNKTCELFGVER